MLIDVAVSRELKPNFVSRQIMKHMGCNYSHIFFIHKDHHIGVDDRGVVVEPLQKFLKEREIVSHVQIPINWSEDYFYGWVEGNKGKEYSESQFLGFKFKALKAWVADQSKELICSEFVGYPIKQASPLAHLVPAELDFVSPKDLFDKIVGWKNGI